MQDSRGTWGERRRRVLGAGEDQGEDPYPAPGPRAAAQPATAAWLLFPAHNSRVPSPGPIVYAPRASSMPRARVASRLESRAMSRAGAHKGVAPQNRFSDRKSKVPLGDRGYSGSGMKIVPPFVFFFSFFFLRIYKGERGKKRVRVYVAHVSSCARVRVTCGRVHACVHMHVKD